MSYHVINFKQCLNSLEYTPQKILVVGCGDECEDIKAINDIMGSHVIIHGVDIIDEIGLGFKSENVLYIKADAS